MKKIILFICILLFIGCLFDSTPYNKEQLVKEYLAKISCNHNENVMVAGAWGEITGDWSAFNTVYDSCHKDMIDSLENGNITWAVEFRECYPSEYGYTCKSSLYVKDLLNINCFIFFNKNKKGKWIVTEHRLMGKGK